MIVPCLDLKCGKYLFYEKNYICTLFAQYLYKKSSLSSSVLEQGNETYELPITYFTLENIQAPLLQNTSICVGTIHSKQILGLC